MSAGRLNTLSLPAYSIDSFTARDGIGFTDPSAFDLSARAWQGKVPRADDAPYVPACWTIHQAWRTWQQFFPTFEEFVADTDKVVVDPRPRFGEQGSVVRAPRAVIFATLGPGGLDDPAHAACRNLRTELEAAHVFCGEAFSFLAFNPWQVCWWGLPHADFDVIDDAEGESFFGLRVDEGKTVGGEVLFVNVVSTGCFSYVPFHKQDCLSPGDSYDLPAMRAFELDLMQRMSPKFGRVKYLYLLYFANDITAGSIASLDSFQADAPEGMFEYLLFDDDVLKTEGNPSPPDLAAATVSVQDKVQEFFGL